MSEGYCMKIICLEKYDFLYFLACLSVILYLPRTKTVFVFPNKEHGQCQEYNSGYDSITAAVFQESWSWMLVSLMDDAVLRGRPYLPWLTLEGGL